MIVNNNKELQDELVNKIVPAYDSFIDAFQQFSDMEINIPPFEGSWTPGQVAHHIILATSGIPDNQTMPPQRPHDEKAGTIDSIFLNFNEKYKSPDFVLPGSGPFEKKRLVEKLQQLKTQHALKILSVDLTAICLGFELPQIGTMSRYEWFRFMTAHTQRHLYQLNNMRKQI